MKKIKYLLPSVIFAFVIFLVSSQENIKLPDIGLDVIDKLLHFSAYLIFGLTIYWAIFNIYFDKTNKSRLIILVIIGTLYSLSDEIHQKFVPGRNFDVFDILADVLGVAVSYFIYELINKLIKTIRKKFV